MPTPHIDTPASYGIKIIRWAGSILVVLGFTSLCFWVLAPWQLGKHIRNQHNNSIIEHSLAQPAQPLSEVNHGIIDTSYEYRLITVSGVFIPTVPTTVRLHLVHQEPATRVLAAFRTDSGKNLLIYRGYLPGDSPTIPLPPHGHITLLARMHNNERESNHKRTALVTPTHIQVYTISSSTLSSLWHLPLETGYFSLEATTPGALHTDPLPSLARGPYLSYGIQWIAFGILAPLGLGYIAYSERKARKILAQHSAGTISSVSPTHKHPQHERKIRKQDLLHQLRGETSPASEPLEPTQESSIDNHQFLHSRYGK